MFSEDFQDLVQQLLASDPKQRPSLGDIKQHPWYTDIKSLPTQQEVEWTMSALKSDFIANTIRDQAEILTQNQADVRLPKSFLAYLVYIYKTGGARSVFRGLVLLGNRVFVKVCRRRKVSSPAQKAVAEAKVRFQEHQLRNRTKFSVRVHD